MGKQDEQGKPKLPAIKPNIDPFEILKKDPNYFKRQTQEIRESLAEKGFQDTTGMNFTLSGTQGIIPKQFRKLDNRLAYSTATLDEADANRRAYVNQSVGEVIKNGVLGFGVNFASGVMDHIGGYDAVDIANMALDNGEQEFGNWATRTANELREYTQEEFSIFQSPEAQESLLKGMGSLSFWANMAQQSGNTVGQIASIFGEQALLTLATADTLGATSGIQATRLAQGISALARSSVRGSALKGMARGIQEGYINGLETQKAVKEKFLGLGYSEEEATRLGAEAATIGFRTEVLPLMALNALQFSTIKKANPFGSNQSGMGISSLAENAFEKALPKINSKWGRGVTGYGVNMASEAIEEGYQAGVQGYAEYAIDKKYNTIGTKTMSDYLWTREMAESMIAGAFMGGVFKGVGDLTSKITKNTNAKIYDEQLSRFMEGTKQMAEDNVSQLVQAQQSGDRGELATALYKNNISNTLAAINHDVMAQKETGFETYIGELEKVHALVQQGNMEELAKHGINSEEDLNYVKESYPKFIQQSKDIRTNFISNVQNSIDLDTAERMTIEQANFNALGELSKDVSRSLDTKFKDDAQFNQLSLSGQERFKKQSELTALNSFDEELLTPEMKARKIELKEDLDNFNTSGALVNEDVLFNTINSDEYVKDYIDLVAINKNRVLSAQEIGLWKDKNYQLKKAKENVETAITSQLSSETDINRLKDLKEKAKSNKFVDKVLLDKIDAKIAEVEVKATVPKTATPREVPNKDSEPINPTAKGKVVEQPTDPKVITDPAKLKKTFERTHTPKMSEQVDEVLTSASDLQAKMDAIRKGLAPRKDEYEGDFNETPSVEPPSDYLNIDADDTDLSKLKEQVRLIYNTLSFDMNRKISFEDMIRYMVQSKGKEAVRPAYEALVEGWKANGYPLNDTIATREAIFNDVDALIDNFLSNPNFATEVDIYQNKTFGREENQAETNAQVNTVQEVDLQSIPKNKITSPYKIGSDLVSTNPNEIVSGELRAAYLSIKYTIDENGNKVNIEDPTLVDTSDVQSHLLLSDNYANIGDTLDVRVPENVNDIYITEWDGSPEGKSMTFGDWVNKNDIAIGSPEYISMIPIIAYQNGVPLFFVHTPDWYRPSNAGHKDNLELQAQMITEGRVNSMALRNSVFSNKGGKIQITSRSLGHMVKIPTDQPKVTSYSQDPTSKVAFIGNGKNFMLSDGSTLLKDDVNITKLNDNDYSVGDTVVIRRSEKGKVIPLLVGKTTMPQEKADTLVEIAKAYYFQHSSEYKNQELRDSFLATTGLDIFKAGDFEKIFKIYANANFVTAKTSDIDINAYMNESTVNKLNPETGRKEATLFEQGRPYFYFEKFQLHYGSVRETQPNSTQQTINIGKPIYADTYFTEQAVQDINNHLERLRALLLKTSVGASKEGFSSFANKPFPNIVDGKIVDTADTYNDYLLKNTLTNVKAFNVGTESNPQYATFVQPVINFKHISTDSESIKIADQDTVIPTEKVYNQDPVSNQDWSLFIQEGQVSNIQLEEIKNKVQAGQNLSEREQAIYIDKTQTIEDIAKDDTTTVEIGEAQLTLEDLKVTYQHFKKLGLEDSHLAVQMILSKIQGYNQDSDALFNLDDSTISPFQSQEFIDRVVSASSKIEGITNKEIQHIATHIFNIVSSKIGLNKGDSITGKEVKDLLKQVNTSFVKDLLNENKSLVNTYENLLSANPDNITLMAIVEALKENIVRVENIDKNWNVILTEAENTIKKFTEIKFKAGIFESMSDNEVLEDNNTDLNKDSEETFTEDTIYNGVDGNFSKLSLEENGKQNSSPMLRRFLSSIQNVTKENQNTIGFLGVPDYVGFDTVFETIQRVLSTPYEIESDYANIIQRLEENVEAYPWLRQVIDKLEASDNQIKNMLTYNMAKHTLSMKFMMFSKDRSGQVSMKVYNTNSNEINYVIRERWNNNFLSGSPLVKVMSEGGLPTYRINKDVAKDLLRTFKNFDVETVTNKELQDWLFNFGIYLSDETLNELRSKSLMFYGEDGTRMKTSFNDQFQLSANSLGLFGQLANYLNTVSYMKDEATNFEENKKAHPFGDINNILKTVINIESKYSMFSTTNSFRDGTKSIFGFTPTKSATDSSHKLRMEDSSYREQMLEKPYQKQSFLLNALQDNPVLRGKFFVDHLGITALKEYGEKVFGDNNEVTNLGNIDLDYTRLGLFQDLEQGDSKIKVGPFSTRMGRMFFPTMSDKSQMLLLNSLLLNLSEQNVEISKDGKFGFTKESLDFFISQLVEPELNRITDYHTKGKKTNIKGYDNVAGLFLQYPELNNLTFTVNGTEFKAIQLMAEEPLTYNKTWFMNNMGSQVRAYINNHLMNEANKELVNWELNNFTKGGNNLMLDKNYVNKFEGDSKTKLTMSAMEYVMNQQLNQAQIQMLFIGDIALYSNVKTNKFFKDGKVYLPKETYGNDVYSYIAKEVVGTNLGKRLAALLAPGSKLANSKNEKYLQVFMKDMESMATNVKAIIKLFHGGEVLKQYNSIINEYFNPATVNKRKAEIVDELSEAMPDIADYFAIEATDAQEYTTLKEHLNVLYGQGRLSQDLYDSLITKANKQIEKDLKGQELDPEDMFTKQELKTVVQPIKPVHTGFYNDTDNDLMRMMYIKTSSFPLIPQLTKGLEIDKLRKMAEKLEATTKKPVRLSYETGNKVGSNTNAITPFDSSGNFNPAILEDLENIKDETSFLESNLFHSTMTLDRDNFRIQQDVPFKSDKRKEDVISLGTQTLKLLFGDGVRNIKGFKYLGNTYDGTQLQAIYERKFVELITHTRDMLYKELDLLPNGQPSSLLAVKKIQALLQSEAMERGYSQQDIDALELEASDKGYSFAMPLWMSPNSGRYESLLNAIVSNRLAHLKMPGSSFVAGSEAGFKTQNNLNGVNQSRIVYTSQWKGELKASGTVDTPQGKKLLKLQVLASSKFRGPNGKLLELFDKEGKPNIKYIEVGENGQLTIKKDMFDAELFSMTSFRIPTSSHVSMSQIEVVGFLPPESGDLMIVPKNLTKQKGLDFDVDKENVYNLWTYITEKGRYKALKEEDIEGLLDKAKAMRADKNLVNTDEEAQGLQDFTSEDIDWNDTEIEEDAFIQRLRDKLTKKALENVFVRIHSSVLSNPSDEMQQKISKVLSMDFAKSQADYIGGLVNTATDNSYFSVFNTDYQNSKMSLGSTGKMGIGVYSNYVVLHSMIQQIDGEVRIQNQDKSPVKFTIGNITADGILGKVRTIDGDRSIAEVLAERQNTATDNEKEQIMGRLNINKHTINVDSFLTLLGFDKVNANVDGENKQLSLSYTLLSQPIIKEYVDMMNNINSNTNSSFTFNAEEAVIDKLIKKYNINLDKPANNEIFDGTRLLQQLTEPTDDYQGNVLLKFLELKVHADNFRAVQKPLSISRTGLGISMFETVEKYDSIGSLKGMSSYISNIEKLIGDFKSTEDMSLMDINNFMANGYRYFASKQLLIKPMTPTGAMYVDTIKSGYDIWNRYFPYDSPALADTFDFIRNMTGNENSEGMKTVEIKQQIFKDVKKMLFSSERLGLFRGPAQTVRANIFIDDLGANQSLASYLNELSNMKSDPIVKKIILDNPLLSRFSYNIKKNGLASTIKFDASRGENFDEGKMYKALTDLLEQNIVLPIERNGKQYTTRNLVEDLIAYSYLEGGVQEATQFNKYIPVSILKNLPFSNIVKSWQEIPDFMKFALGSVYNQDGKKGVTNFIRQYIQHNANKAIKVDLKATSMKDFIKNYNGTKLEDLHTFVVNYDVVPQIKGKDFFSIYDAGITKGLQKYHLYQLRNPNTGEYVKIDTLGMFGMTEYTAKPADTKHVYVTSILGKPFIPQIQTGQSLPQQTTNTIGNQETGTVEGIPDLYNVRGTNSLKTLLKNIVDKGVADQPELQKLAEFMLNNIVEDITIKTGTNNNVRTIADYNKTTNEITIYNESLDSKSPSIIAKNILHEGVHAFVVNYINKFIDNNGKYLVDSIPADIQNLVSLFNRAKRDIDNSVIEALNDKVNAIRKGDTSVSFTSQEAKVTYGLTSVQEFVTLVLTEPDFQKAMGEVYIDEQKISTLWDRFTEIVSTMMSRIFGQNIPKNSVTYNAIATSMSIIENSQANRIVKSEVQQISDIDDFKALQARMNEIRTKEAMMNNSNSSEGFKNPSNNENIVTDFESLKALRENIQKNLNIEDTVIEFNNEDLDKLPTC